MTEHFTREEAVALAKKAEVILAYHDDELGVTPDEILVLINEAVSAKLKEWEAQGAVAVLYPNASFGEVGEQEYSVMPKDAHHHIMDLTGAFHVYTHALPAQPAEQTIADDGYEMVAEITDNDGEHVLVWNIEDPDEYPVGTMVYVRMPSSRTQAAPEVGVPDSCIWTPDADYETDIHYSECGEAWSFIEGGPTENNVRFCQGCGKPVVIASAQPQQKEG